MENKLQAVSEPAMDVKDSIILILSVFLFVLGVHVLTTERYNEGHAIRELEKNLALFQDYFGKDEKQWRKSGNYLNVPNEYFVENLTVNEAIEAYWMWKPPSELVASAILRDICTG